MSAVTLSRRELLRSGGALLLGFSMRPAPAAGDAAFAPNAWIRIERDGAVQVLISKTEMGQGTATGIAMIVADELDADWARVSVHTIRPDGKRFMITGGSYSIAGAWVAGRKAAAAARRMLLTAGADTLGVSADQCRTGQHRVEHAASGRSVGYGELVARAAALPVPQDAPLKRPEAFTLIGKPLAAKNLHDIVSARARYGCDVRVPGMLFAVIGRAPVLNARLATLDDRAARAVPGVVRVVPLRGNPFPTLFAVRDGVGVVARSTWAALQGREKLRLTWNESWTEDPARNGAAVSSTALSRDFAAALADPPAPPSPAIGASVLAHREGTAEAMDAAFAGAARRLDLSYELPLQAHAPMETMDATVHWQSDRIEAWVPCHFQTRLLDALGEISGLPPPAIHIHTPMLGGSFGRRLDVDYAIEAALLSRECGAPVQLLWTREDDMRFGPFAPPSRHRVRVALDAQGGIAALDHHFATVSVWQQSEPQMLEGSGLDFAAAIDAIKFPYSAPQRLVRHRLLPRALRVLWWRRGYTPNHTFVNECLLDECARAAGQDPLAWRLRQLGAPRPLQWRNKDDNEAIHTARLAAVLRAAADAAGWGTPRGAGRGRGLAATVTDTYVAQVVEVDIRDGRIHVERVITALDCGITINPQLVHAQVEGSIAFALTAALGRPITLEAGRVQQSNFHDHPLLTIYRMPQVLTVILPSGEAPSGVGEPISHPVAAALANAIADAGGPRLRALPLRL